MTSRPPKYTPPTPEELHAASLWRANTKLTKLQCGACALDPGGYLASLLRRHGLDKRKAMAAIAEGVGTAPPDAKGYAYRTFAGPPWPEYRNTLAFSDWPAAFLHRDIADGLDEAARREEWSAGYGVKGEP